MSDRSLEIAGYSLLPRLPGLQKKRGHCPRQIDRKFRVAWRRLCSRRAFAMRITVAITHRAQSFDNGLAAAEYLLEQLFRVLARREIELLCCQRVELGQSELSS